MPNAAPASVRSNGMPISCAVSTTLRTLIDDRRPQSLSMITTSGRKRERPWRVAARSMAQARRLVEPGGARFTRPGRRISLTLRRWVATYEPLADEEVEATAGGGAQAPLREESP